MGWRGTLALGLLWLAAGAPLRADSPAARILVQDCAQQADSGHRGIEALRADCPGVGPAIEELGFDAFLPKDWSGRISPRTLADLNALANRYAQPGPRMLPDPSSLQMIARRLGPSPSATWWERLKSWIVSWLDSDRNRWPDWLRSLPDWRSGARLLFYGSIGLVVIAATVVITLELRAAGVLGLGRRRTAPSGRAVRDPQPTVERALTPADIDAAAEHVRPVILLRLLVAALTRSQRLERDGVLTCRELITAARFDTATQREVFTNVALLAEQVLYGDPRRALLSLDDRLLGDARGLYTQLAAAPAEQP